MDVREAFEKDQRERGITDVYFARLGVGYENPIIHAAWEGFRDGQKAGAAWTARECIA